MYIVPSWLALLLGIIAGVAIYRGMRTGSLVRFLKDGFIENNKKDCEGNHSLKTNK